MPRFTFTLLALSFATNTFAQDAKWQAGFATVSITPKEYMWMSGYGGRTAPADGKETELYSKAMVLQTPEGQKRILVTLDLVGIDRDTSIATCKAIMDKHKVPREAIILSTTHTHCGPVVGRNLRSMYFFDEAQGKLVDDYTAKLPALILKSVDDAVERLAPAELSSTVGSATFAVNRRTNKEADVPTLRAKGELKGPVDHDVPVLAVRDSKGTLKGVVFGYACHATVMGYQKWSGDYPGFAMIELEKAHPGVVAMFWAGCGADQNPLPRRTVELAKSYGKQLADAVEAVLAKPMTAVTGKSTAIYKEIDLPLADVPDRESFVKESMSENKFVAGRAKMLLQKIKAGEKIPESYPYPIQTWQLGKGVTLAILGGEVVVDFSLRFKKEFGANLWTMSYANDVMAYIPSLRVLKEGGYEGGGAMVYYGLPAVWGTKVEDLIADEVRRQVNAARKE